MKKLKTLKKNVRNWKKCYNLNDEIKQYNKIKSNLLSDIEKIKSSFNLLKIHIKLTKEKIEVLDKKSDEFF